MHYCSVVVCHENVVYNNYLFVNKDNNKVAKAAEKKFVSLLNHYYPNNNFDKEDINDILDDGYYDENEYSICIHWPQLSPIRSC